MILPTPGDVCSCGHIWTDDDVRRIWERSPFVELIEATLGGEPVLEFFARPGAVEVIDWSTMRRTVITGTVIV